MTFKDSTYQELQKEIFENNNQLDLIFNTLPQSMALVNPDFEILRVNGNFLSLYGVKNEDVIGMKCYNACFGRENVCENCLVERAIKSKKTEKKIKSFPNGEVCEMTARPVLDDKGEVTHILDIRTNITELVEKDREIRRIQFAMDQSADEFWLFNNKWNVIYASNAASKNLGYSISELKSIPLGRINMIDRLENLSDLMAQLRKKKNIRIESVQFKKDGNTYPCEMNLSYFYDMEEYVYAVVRDITKRKQRENALIESREKAEKALKLKSTFLANMSHEIRTPLNAIIGFSGFIMDEELDAETKNDLKKDIIENSNYLLSIISDIMEISQIESGNRNTETTDFNVAGLLNNIYNDFSCFSTESLHLDLNLNIPDSLLIMKSDKSMINKILTYLLKNAFKFTSKGMITIGCSFDERKKGYNFYIEDTGIGIEKEYYTEIFEPFFQIDPMVKGTGIGLTICQGLASMLDSKIKVESIVSKGSKFSFFIRSK
jgi:PAS domain S-box-containing protein